MKESADIRVTGCPCCHKKLDRAFCPEDENAIPQSGDLTICIHCASFLIFVENLQVRLLTFQEIALLSDKTRNILIRARRAVERANQQVMADKRA